MALAALVGVALAALVLAPALLAAGPPFRDPVTGQSVYDRAGVLSADAVARTQATIDAIRARTGAEIVVYTQLVESSITAAEGLRRVWLASGGTRAGRRSRRATVCRRHRGTLGLWEPPTRWKSSSSF